MVQHGIHNQKEGIVVVELFRDCLFVVWYPKTK